MKNIFKILFLLTISFSCSAQNQPVLRTIPVEQRYSEDFDLKSGDYIKDINNRLNAYVGTWEYNNGNGIILTIKLQKKIKNISIFHNGSYNYFDEIISTYRLVKNGTTLVDNLDLSIPNNFNNLGSNNMKYGKFHCVEIMHFISGKITDLTLGITTTAEIELVLTVLNTPPQIKFRMYGNDSYRIHPDSFYEGKPTFEIPNFITLTKIN